MFEKGHTTTIKYAYYMLREKVFSSGKKGLCFESVPILSNFCPKNRVISNKKVFTLNLSLISRISVLQDLQRAWHNAPHKYITSCKHKETKNSQ